MGTYFIQLFTWYFPAEEPITIKEFCPGVVGLPKIANNNDNNNNNGVCGFVGHGFLENV